MESIKAKAFALLARKGYFSKQLRQKLLGKGFPAAEIEALIKELTSRGWLNDKELAARYVEQLKARGYGARRIFLQLRERAGEIDLEIEESQAVLEDLIKKKYLSKLAENRDKVIQALLRRGFSYDLISRVIRHQYKD